MKCLEQYLALFFKKPSYDSWISRKVDISKKRRNRKEKAFPLLPIILFHVQDNNNTSLKEKKKKNLFVPSTHSFKRGNQHLLGSYHVLYSATNALNPPPPVVSPKPNEVSLPFFYKGRSQVQKTWVYWPRSVNAEIRIKKSIELCLLAFTHSFKFNHCFLFKALSDHSDLVLCGIFLFAEDPMLAGHIVMPSSDIITLLVCIHIYTFTSHCNLSREQQPPWVFVE